eukprot:m.889243 g.889243  ORF g.889243 m.889243 type:complete len:227 (+) comp23642_c2_seq9:240-920(+)
MDDDPANTDMVQPPPIPLPPLGEVDVVLDLVSVGEVLGDVRDAFGRAEIDRPVLRGYSDARPVYVVDTPIAPNTPSFASNGAVVFYMEPAVPTGLALDAATGVLSGTPTWPEDARATGAAETTVQCTVVVENSAGTATTDMAITLTQPQPSPPPLQAATMAFLERSRLSVTDTQWRYVREPCERTAAHGQCSLFFCKRKFMMMARAHYCSAHSPILRSTASTSFLR